MCVNKTSYIDKRKQRGGIVGQRTLSKDDNGLLFMALFDCV